MSGSGLYKNYKRADAQLLETGYLKAWINIKSDFTALQEPPALTTDSVTGDNKIITTAHTWAAGKGAMELYVNYKTIEAPAESTGEPGSLRLLWKPKIFLRGDGPVAQDLAENFLNQEIILFVQDQCQNSQFIQFGCDCEPGEVSKLSFSSGTLPSGAKGWQFEIDFWCRYFYNAAITHRA